eukprot:CAMPEP_0204901688 /NCGR_PEP_ID=MMETSP1397-20131031/3223_1 /ASSEMBLY_ACC=CAM_ASM_000891 /TAXON_ID=49980 /ORGANISM="Climacostomum Climacostomum virens, Strain Stock W-24" /LENGTH=69 /DNA_ID=CAMNT_0052070075 /DNA_START=414 /DNA_END=623 /DNA_ORIENTATION=+
MGEVVSDLVVGKLEEFVAAHEVDDVGSEADEGEFHEGVIEANSVKQQVQVPRHEHQQVKLLRLAAYASA